MTLSADLQEHEVSDEVIILNTIIAYIIVSWLLDFQFKQIFLSAVLGLIFQVGFTLLGALGASWDFILNPWIENVHFDRWNLFTTKHYSAWLLHKDEKLWLRQWVFFGIPMMVSFGAMIFDFAAGLVSFFLNIVSTTILLLVIWQIRAND